MPLRRICDCGIYNMSPWLRRCDLAWGGCSSFFGKKEAFPVGRHREHQSGRARFWGTAIWDSWEGLEAHPHSGLLRRLAKSQSLTIFRMP